MTPEEAKAYQRGYAAGRKTFNERRTSERLRREKQAMLDRIYLALLPAYVSMNLNINGVAVTPIKDKVKLAAEMAEHAYKHRPAV